MHDFSRLVRERLPALHMRPERENEIVAELALQLEQAYNEAVSGGASDGEALRRALAQMGDWEKLGRSIDTAEPRSRLTTGWRHDLRFALRFFARNPAFSAIATLTLAFGIGGNTAIFTMVDALVLRGLPYPSPDRLVVVETRKAQQPEVDPWTSAADFFDLRQQARSFSAMASISPVWNVVLTGKGRAEQLDALYVSAQFFPMLGMNAALGRTFSPEEDQGTKPSPVVLLSHEFWQRRFGSSPDVVGQSLNLDGAVYNVIGVLPAKFHYGGEPLAGSATQISVWFPMSSNQLVASARSVRYLKVVGRLRDGVSVAQSREETRRLAAGLALQHPDFDRGFEWDVRPLSDQVTGKLRLSMLLLLGTVGFVLLMACANVANLQLARAVARQREMAVRVAMGAGVYRLLRQLLTEGLVLAAMGGLAGLPLAWAGLRFLIAIGPPALVQTQEIRLDGRALLFTTAAVLLCALVAGMPLAWRMVRARTRRRHAAERARAGGRASSGARGAGFHAGGGGAGAAGRRGSAGAQLHHAAGCESRLRHRERRDHLHPDARVGANARAARRIVSHHLRKAPRHAGRSGGRRGEPLADDGEESGLARLHRRQECARTARLRRGVSRGDANLFRHHGNSAAGRPLLR